MTPILHADMEVASCDVRFLVNDIPVGVLHHRLSVFQALPIHEYLVQGENTLRIERMDTPAPVAAEEEAGDADPAGAPGAVLTVAAYMTGMTPGHDQGKVAGRLAYKSLDAAGKPVLSADGQFSLSAWPLRWSWQSLQPTDWSAPSAVHAVFQFLQTFAQRFKAGDASAVSAALQPKMSDYCHAYGLDLQTEIIELNARMARRAADPSFAMQPFTESDLALRPCAGGRLVDCVLASGEPVIRWRDARAGNRGSMAMRVGLAEQRLQVFR